MPVFKMFGSRAIANFGGALSGGFMFVEPLGECSTTYDKTLLKLCPDPAILRKALRS